MEAENDGKVELAGAQDTVARFLPQDWGLALLQFVLLLWLAAPAFSCTFRNDDWYHLARTAEMFSGNGIFSMLTSTQQLDEKKEYGWKRYAEHSDLYRPALDVSFGIDRLLYGMWYPGYRFTNILIYSLSALLVYGLGLLVFSSRAVAVLASLLFINSHGHAEALGGQIAGRSDALAGLFVLLAFWLFVKYRRVGSWKQLLAAVLASAAALLSKETAAGLAAILLAYDVIVLGTFEWKKLRVHAALFGILAAYLLTRLALMGNLGHVTGPEGHGPLRMLRHADVLVATLLPLSLVNRYAVILFPLTLAAAFALWPVLRRDARLKRYCIFAVVACYLAAGPALLLPGLSVRMLYTSSGFLLLGVAAAVVSAWRVGAGMGAARQVLQRMAPALLVLILLLSGVEAIRSRVRGSQAASLEVASLQKQFRSRFAAISPGDKVFFVVIPASCSNQGIFYNGMQDWVRLVLGDRVRPYVLSSIAYAECAKPPDLDVRQVSPGAFEVRFTGTGGPGEVVLSQTELSRLEPGDSLENNFCSVTLLEANRAAVKSVIGRTWSARVPKAVRIQIKKEILESPGRNFYFYANGGKSWMLAEGGWQQLRPDSEDAGLVAE